MNPLKLYIMAACLVLLACSSKKSDPPAQAVTTAPIVSDKVYTFEATPSWTEEFNSGTAPDTSRWGYETGGNGWGNHELEYYTPGNNVEVKEGNLVLTAKKESWSGMNYTSARLYSKGTGNFLYGRFEIRAKIPAGRGTWPAIWMLPTDNVYGGWPKSGEMDIMEHVGYDPNNIYVTMHTDAYNHTKGTQKSATINLPSSTTDFHIYRIDWTPAAITGFIDGNQVFVFKNEGTGSAAWPFDKRFHMMLNIAVGGDWGGAQGVDDGVFPAGMLIDYIRIYKVTNL